MFLLTSRDGIPWRMGNSEGHFCDFPRCPHFLLGIASHQICRDDVPMQRLLTVCLLLFSPLCVGSSSDAASPGRLGGSGMLGIQWHRNFNQGWAAAKNANRPLLIYITAPGCVYCDAMKRDTWCDAAIETEVTDDFIAIELSPEQNAEVLSRIKVQAYPMTLVGSPEGKILDHRVGYQPPHEMRQLLRATRVSVANRLRKK